FGELNNGLQLSNGSVHRETAVRGNESEARILCGAELGFEIGHVVVLVTKALRFAEPDAIDDAGVIQFIADHRVFVGEQRLEQAAVCIATGWIKNRIFGAEEFGKRCFEFLVNVLCATNKTHTRHSKSVRLESLFGRSD